jgi:hypothetical protein
MYVDVLLPLVTHKLQAMSSNMDHDRDEPGNLMRICAFCILFQAPMCTYVAHRLGCAPDSRSSRTAASSAYGTNLHSSLPSRYIVLYTRSAMNGPSMSSIDLITSSFKTRTMARLSDLPHRCDDALEPNKQHCRRQVDSFVRLPRVRARRLACAEIRKLGLREMELHQLLELEPTIV